MTNSYSENFKDFLSSEDLYYINKSFWERTVLSITETPIQPWVENKYGNGKEIIDGNPLYSCRFDETAIRIIQSKRNKLTPVFASWNSEYDINSSTIKELVIAIQPYKRTYFDSIKLLEKFIKGGNYKSTQSIANLRYNRLTNINRIEFLISSLERSGIQNNHLNIKMNDFLNGHINLRRLKNINEVTEKLVFYESKFENKNLNKLYNSTLKSLLTLNKTTTLKYNYSFDKLNERNYRKAIVDVYSSFDSYLKSYNKQIDNLEDHYEKLKKSLHELHNDHPTQM